MPVRGMRGATHEAKAEANYYKQLSGQVILN